MRFDISPSASLVLGVELLQLHQMIVALDRRFLVAFEELGCTLGELARESTVARLVHEELL